MNYVDIVLDKDTGKLIALPGIWAGGGGGGSAAGYSHDQTTPASVWTVTHSLNTNNIVYQLYDSSNEQIIPDTFIIVDPNTVEVTFGIPQTGYLKLITF